MARGKLRVYLGAAPGVGKTYAALREAHRRAERGTDVVVGLVETHGRPATAALLDGLEVVPRRRVDYRGTTFEEFDPAAVLRRRPAVALVDELAHTNVPGSGHTKRWQDIEDLLEAGVDVISTVNIQHLESLNDVVAGITGVPQRETIPDEVVRRADQVELADMTPEALRRRMSHGNIYPSDKIDASLTNYFRVGNLTALRELALLWLADKVEDQLAKYRRDQDIQATWESKERVVVALSGGPEGDTLIRRAKRVATRSGGAELQAVYVAGGDGLGGGGHTGNLARQRLLVESLGGTFHQVVGDDIPDALLEFARGANATQLVLGASRRGRFAHLLSSGVGMTIAARSGPIDVHLVTHERVARGRSGPGRRPLISVRRRLTGLAMTVLGLPALIAALIPFRADLSLSSVILIVLTAVLGITFTGGMWPGLLAAVGGFVLLNLYFTVPYHSLTVADHDNALGLVVFVLLASAGAAVLNLSAYRARQAARAGAEAQTLAGLAGSVLRGGARLGDLLEQLRETFGLTSVTLLERATDPAGPDDRHDPDSWRVIANAGEPVRSPGSADTEVPVGDDLSLALSGRALAASDRRIVEAFAMHAAAALRHNRLAVQASRARRLAEADKLRTALLAAVSHDLRTPLASARAAVSSLVASPEVFSAAERVELLDTAEESLDRLTRLVENLLDMSRLEAGSLGAYPVALGLEDAVPSALDELGSGHPVVIAVPADLPAVLADPGLLERILVNVIGNAVRYSPPGVPVTVTAVDRDDRVELRVVDHGPGVAADEHDAIFRPFQRRGDRDTTTGVGLGLALSRGLAEAMGGGLAPADTPGGGLTMVLTLPVDTDQPPAPDPPEEP